MTKIKSAAEAARLVSDGDVVAVNSSSGLCCPDAVLAAIGERYEKEGGPSGLTAVHPIAAGDLFGTPGVDHIARPGLISKIIAAHIPPAHPNPNRRKFGS